LEWDEQPIICEQKCVARSYKKTHTNTTHHRLQAFLYYLGALVFYIYVRVLGIVAEPRDRWYSITIFVIELIGGWVGEEKGRGRVVRGASHL
jgi:hypothetical protein